MANSRQATKRARQAEKRRKHNASIKSMMRTFIKKVLAEVEAGDKTKATEAYKTMEKVLDKVCNKGIIHRNKAARHKSRLSAKIKAMAA